MQIIDQRGLTYSASTSAALEAFNIALDSFVYYSSTTMDQLVDIIASDDAFAMAQLMRAYLLKMGSDRRLKPSLAAISAQLKTMELNHREALHLRALNAWLNGDSAAALVILESVLDQYPRDMVALKAAHHLHFYSGDARAMRDSVRRVLPSWDENDPFRGAVLGMLSFGCEESGDYEEAERSGRMAVEGNPADMWAAHAVTHVMQMQGRYAEGVAWVSGLLPHWHGVNNFVFHLHWHQALLHLGNDELDACTQIYRQHLAGALSADFYLDFCNSASLLWRLEARGLDMSEEWQALLPYCASRCEDNELVFISLHYVLVAARCGDAALQRRCLDALTEWANEASTQGQVARALGLPAAQAMTRILARRKPADAPDWLAGLHKIGGSHAQRQLFSELAAS